MWILFVFMSIMFMAQNVFAAMAQVTYTEPTQNQAGNSLTNLKETSIYYRIDGGLEQTLKVPASSLSGGGAISRNITIPDPPICGVVTISAQVSASNTNTTNFESPRTTVVSTTKSNVTPGCSISNAPSNLTITIP